MKGYDVVISKVVITVCDSEGLRVFSSVVCCFRVGVTLKFRFVVFYNVVNDRTRAFGVPFCREEEAFHLVSTVMRTSIVMAIRVWLSDRDVFVVCYLLRCGSGPYLFSFNNDLGVGFFLDVDVFS